MEYIFTWRRWFFWHKIKVVWHGVMRNSVRDSAGRKIKVDETKDKSPIFDTEYDTYQDKMVLKLLSGEVREIKNWSQCEAKLGPDYFSVQEEARSMLAGLNTAANK